ncbi:hypothetical protein NH26_11545 [Flammeovirga pacifica]|uniref:Secretion system C-terminal sorting domain-containing protein n=2 Tax=Flammeovirga pacifica TaxID=915059 RepID=A0A1S1Z176_FLAPC|nr:hypothetical protein NH26_11545 [Flammeovirga pacifica]
MLILTTSYRIFAQTCGTSFGNLNTGTTYTFSDCKLTGGDVEFSAQGGDVDIIIAEGTTVIWEVDSLSLTSEKETISGGGGSIDVDLYGINITIEPGATLYIKGNDAGNLTINHKSSINVAHTGQLIIEGNYDTDDAISPEINILDPQTEDVSYDQPIYNTDDVANVHIHGNADLGYTNGNSPSKIYIIGSLEPAPKSFDDSYTTYELIEQFLIDNTTWFAGLSSFAKGFVMGIAEFLLSDSFPPINDSNTGFISGISGERDFVDLPVDLPVELTYFEANVINNEVELSWETATEINASHFLVQRSTDKSNWETIGEVEASGNTNYAIEYEFVDESPLKIAYYRLHQFDFDGANELFGPIKVQLNNSLSDFDVVLMPNVIQNGNNTRSSFTGLVPNTNVIVKLFDGSGRMLYSDEYQANSESMLKDLDVPDGLHAGVYYLHFQNGSELKRKRLILK